MRKIVYAIFVSNLLVIIYFWWHSSVPFVTTNMNISSLLLAIGRLLGLLAVYAILIQFIFMGRVRWVEETFGLDNLAWLHHWNGYVSFTLILLHPSFITISYAIDEKTNIVHQFLDFLFNYEDILQAVLAVIIFCAIIISSIYIVRKKVKYEYWFFIHLATYIAIILVWGHQLILGGDFGNSKIFSYYWYALYIFVFTNVIFYRFIRQLYLFYYHRFTIEKIIPETKNVFSIYITGKNIKKFTFQPGQFISLRFLNQYWWQQHPFSLSSLPKQNSLRISVKHAGDFTSKVHEFKSGTPILLDGPFGSFIQKKKYRNKILFIAGGIGITPVRVLLEEAAANGKDIILISANRTEKDIVFKNELSQLAKKYNVIIHNLITQKTKEGNAKSHLNAQKMQAMVRDILEREIFICGPVKMMTTIEKELRSLGLKKTQIHYEKFSLQ